MFYKKTTNVPNFIFDTFLPHLTYAEIKLLMVVIRQTIGWHNPKTGKRKTRDGIALCQFQKKTGLSRRALTKSIKLLIAKELLLVTDFEGNELHLPSERKGKPLLHFSLRIPKQFETSTNELSTHEPVHKGYHNKTNYPKRTKTKLSTSDSHIGNILKKRQQTLFDRP